MQSIKTRLDGLDNELDNINITVGGYKFTHRIKNGWNVSVSSAGFTLASVELDLACTWSVSSSPFGSYRCSVDVQEALPTDTFTFSPSVRVVAYCDNANYSFLCLPIAASSPTYIGKWQIIMFDKTNTGENKPTTIHLTINAQGF